MKKTIDFLIIGLFVLLAVVLANPVFAGNGTIKGKVLPADSNATVFVTYQTIFANYSTITIVGLGTINDNGEYSISVIPGVYNLLFAANGYINKTLFQIIVNEDAVTEVQDINLAKIGETGSISGYVNPIIPGIKVEVKKFGAVEFSGLSIVDRNGRYEINGLEPDNYGLFVRFNSSQDFVDYMTIIDIFSNISLSGINLTFTPKSSKYDIDRIIVEFKKLVAKQERIEIIKSYNSRIMDSYNPDSLTYTMYVPPDKTPEEMIEIVNKNPKVNHASLARYASIGKLVIIDNQTKLIINEILSNYSNKNSIIDKNESESKKNILFDETYNQSRIQNQKLISETQNNSPEEFTSKNTFVIPLIILALILLVFIIFISKKLIKFHI